MTETFRAVTPDGRWMVEVAEQADSSFKGTVVLDGDNLIEAYVTPDSDKMVRWAYRQMKEAMRRSKPTKEMAPKGEACEDCGHFDVMPGASCPQCGKERPF